MASAVIVTTPAYRAEATSLRWVRRALYVALLVAAPWLPHLGNSYRAYPEVSHFWVMLPLCGLFLVPLVDLQRPWRWRNLDLLALLSFGFALDCWRTYPSLGVLCIYPALVYLGVRMVLKARASTPPVGADTPADGQAVAVASGQVHGSPALPRLWLIAGIAVLTVVQANWTLTAGPTTDVGTASVHGAQLLVHGDPVYGVDRALNAGFGYDPHFDTYGPVVYEAYVPFVSLATRISTATRWAALSFLLLTALLLFALGRSYRDATAGLTLAYAWLSFPLTLNAGALAENDALVAAALVGVLLCARYPARRGLAAALAAWTKLSPLALIPVLLTHASPGRSQRVSARGFAAAFLLTSVAVIVPALLHSSPATFISRTFGFQLHRPPGFSVWEELNYLASTGSSWLRPVAAVVHGLLLASTAAFMLVFARSPRRQDVAGLAAACAAALTAVMICAGYFSITYVMWLAPLVLVTLELAPIERTSGAPS